MQSQGQLHSRLKWSPVEGLWFGYRWSHSGWQLIEHCWGHSGEVGEGCLVLVTEFCHKLVIHAKLSSPPNPWSHTVFSLSFTSFPTGSFGTKVESQIYEVMLILQDSQVVLQSQLCRIIHLSDDNDICFSRTDGLLLQKLFLYTSSLTGCQNAIIRQRKLPTRLVSSVVVINTSNTSIMSICVGYKLDISYT